MVQDAGHGVSGCIPLGLWCIPKGSECIPQCSRCIPQDWVCIPQGSGCISQCLWCILQGPGCIPQSSECIPRSLVYRAQDLYLSVQDTYRRIRDVYHNVQDSCQGFSECISYMYTTGFRVQQRSSGFHKQSSGSSLNLFRRKQQRNIRKNPTPLGSGKQSSADSYSYSLKYCSLASSQQSSGSS